MRWLAAAGCLVMAMASPAWAADRLAMRLDWITEAVHMPFFLAIERGWFTQAGLDVSIEDGNGSTTTVQLVGSGNFDLGMADLSPMMIARTKGVPVISVAGMIRKGGMGVIVPVAAHVTDIAGLTGKEIIYTAGSLEGPFVEPFLRTHGISLSQVTLTNVSAASKLSLYLSGHGDAVISTVPATVTAAAVPRPSEGLLFWDNGFRVPGFGIIARPASLAEKGAAIRRFVGVVCGAWDYILANPTHMREAARAVRAQRPTTPLSEAMLFDQTEAYRPYFYTDATKDGPLCVQSDADWAATIKTMEDAKVIPPGSKPADFYTNDFVDTALLQKLAAGG